MYMGIPQWILRSAASELVEMLLKMQILGLQKLRSSGGRLSNPYFYRIPKDHYNTSLRTVVYITVA